MAQESVTPHLLVEQATGRPVSRETMTALSRFADLFEKWASRINLVAPSTRNIIWERHIADSARLVGLHPQAKQWIDLGSGGGFPGIITAILLRDFGDGWVNLVESNHKKAAFLRTALIETGARGSVIAERIEDVHERLSSCDAISARALADLDKLLDYAAPWCRAGTDVRCFFHKGRDYFREVDKARDRWQFDLVIHPSAIEADSVILEITGLSRRD